MPRLFDTHVHTAEVSACATVRGYQMAGMYKETGYDGIVITDHFTSSLPRRLSCGSWADCVEGYLAGYRAAKKRGDEIGLRVLWGLEITFDYGPAGDFLVYGVDETFLLDHPDILALDLSGFARLIDGKDIVIYQAHPFRAGHVLAPVTLLDGIEVINGNPRHAHNSEEAEKAATLHHLDRIAGSDAHQPEDVGRAGVTLPRMPESMTDFVAMLRSGHASILEFDEETERKKLRA